MSAQQIIPRVVVAATASGVGKTTVTVGLAAALRARGLRVATFKCGPDYLDPTYHARVTGRPSQNLDGWMMGRGGVATTFARASAGADIALIEGMMGLFDGAAPDGDEGSTAEIAKWLEAPVALVLDASGIARTVAAYAAGFARFDPDLRLAALICNRVGGRGHLELLRAADCEVPVVGGLPAEGAIAFPERHLGLRTADENSVPQSLFDRWARLAADWIDLDSIVAIARSAPPLNAPPDVARAGRERSTVRIGLAYDGAFHFYYDDNLRRLESLGATLVRFAPTVDAALPDVDGLYFGGGYPEVFARELSENLAMRTAVRDFGASGGPIYAECGGLMYLADAIRTLDGRTWAMAGLIPGVAVMSERLRALGYVEVTTRAPTILGLAGLNFRGHQFRYSTLDPPPSAERTALAYRVSPRWGGAPFEEGYCAGNVLGSYVHAHWASNPAAAEGFVKSCAARRAR